MTSGRPWITREDLERWDKAHEGLDDGFAPAGRGVGGAGADEPDPDDKTDPLMTIPDMLGGALLCPPPAPICQQCGSDYVDVEHPLKPGVIMSRVCKCEPYVLSLGGNLSVRTLVPPLDEPIDEAIDRRVRAIVEAIREHGQGTMVPMAYESVYAAIDQLLTKHHMAECEAEHWKNAHSNLSREWAEHKLKRELVERDLQSMQAERDKWAALADARRVKLERQDFAGETDAMALARMRAEDAKGTADHRALVIADLQHKVATARQVIQDLTAPHTDSIDVANARTDAWKFLEDTSK